MKDGVLYRIKPVDKKSIELFYDVYKELPDGSTVGWSVKELYRWGQGFVEDEMDLPYIESKYVCVNPNIGDGCDLDDGCSIDFEYDDEIDQDERKLERGSIVDNVMVLVTSVSGVAVYCVDILAGEYDSI